MNNLKKVLALGLALVMLLGMFTIASAAEDKMVATDLADWDSVSHKDAVSLMVDLGIINGIKADDGKVNFQPDGNIDRASWAKMVYFAATASDNADFYKGTVSGLKDIAGNWAEGHISFLAANKYISGDGAGNYNPSNNVTVAEACKMMLTLLGYDAEDRGYQNNSAWAGNIMVDARRFGLMENVDSAQTALVPLTRENAAEIVMNAMNANTVEAIPQWDAGNRYITTYNKIGTLGYDVFNMVRVTATVGSIDTNGCATFSDVKTDTGVCQINTTNINGKVKATAKMVGEDVSVYVKADGAKWDDKGELSRTGTFVNVISSSVARTDDVATKVITSGISRWNDVTKRGTSVFVATGWAETEKDTKNQVDWYYNGSSTNVTEATIQAAAAKRGTVVEFYTNNDGVIDTVKAYEYTVGQLTNGDAASRTLADGTVQVRVPGIVNTWTDEDKVTGWQGLVEDDVVIYYTTTLEDNVKAYTIEKAEKVTGKVTSFNSSGVLSINGASYKGSEQPKSGSIGDVVFTPVDASHTNDAQGVFGKWTDNYTLTDEYDFFLDKNGSIVACIQLTESLDNSKVCMVLAAEHYDSQLGSNGSLSAELLFVDGTTDIVNVSKVGVNVDGKVVTKSVVAPKAGATDVANPDRQISTADAHAALLDDNGDVMTKFFTYRATSAGYELTELNSSNYVRYWEDPVNHPVADADSMPGIVKASNFAKQPGVSTTDGANLAGWKVTADSNTTFVVGKRNANDDTVAYSVYKGFRNVPAMNATALTAICANTDTVTPSNVNWTAKYVYLETGAFKDDVPDGYIFIRSSEVRIDPELADDDVYLVKIVDVDGQETEMRVDYTLMQKITADSVKLSDSQEWLGHYFAIGDIDENGVVSSLTNGAEKPTVDTPVTTTDLAAIGNDVITLADGKSYDYDDATKFIYVDWGWADSETNVNSVANIREPEYDEVSFFGAGTFAPNGFFNENDVAGTDQEGATTADPNPIGATYISVQAVVVCPANSTTADYVYVLRTCW